MATASSTSTYKPSKFLSLSHEPDGAMVLHNSRTGALGVIPAEHVADVRRALLPNAAVPSTAIQGPLKDLVDGGFLVLSGTDEDYLATNAHVRRYTDHSLHLIVMPTEQCNFRCVYCYESFKRGAMRPDVQQGVINLVKGTPDLQSLVLSWFGGEPLMERDIVLRVTRELSQYAAYKHISLVTVATTNGYYLEPDYAEEVIAAGLTNFQLTLDGVREEHDHRRVAADGSPTFDRIWANLLHLRRSNLSFLVSLRHNFDPGNYSRLDEFLELLASTFGGDDRFDLELQPIGRWGGENDRNLTVCEGRDVIDTLFRAKEQAAHKGFRDSIGPTLLEPSGSVCYAADPHSFVIGPNGQLYKCTVELDYHERNMVGQLKPDGTLELDWSRMALWTETDGLDPGSKCQPCYFRGACHGAVCPKEWLDQGDCGCPPVKHGIKQELHLIRKESLLHTRS